jgi:DnaJ-class molecular chaperone
MNEVEAKLIQDLKLEVHPILQGTWLVCRSCAGRGLRTGHRMCIECTGTGAQHLSNYQDAV